jgi:hypothetical protein
MEFFIGSFLSSSVGPDRHGHSAAERVHDGLDRPAGFCRVSEIRDFLVCSDQHHQLLFSFALHWTCFLVVSSEERIDKKHFKCQIRNTNRNTLILSFLRTKCFLDSHFFALISFPGRGPFVPYPRSRKSALFEGPYLIGFFSPCFQRRPQTKGGATRLS